MKVLVVVPAFNEERAVGPLLAEVLKEATSLSARFPRLRLEVAVVDDGSRDRTSEVAAAAGARVVTLPRNLGIGGAVQTGIRLAWREHFDWAVQMDGDGQHPPGELGKLLAAGEESPRPDMILGTRYRSREGFQSTALRRVGSGWLRFILRACTGLVCSDPTSGFRAYGRRALELFERSYSYDYPEPESLAMAKAAGLHIQEVPVVMRERQAGTSSIGRWHAPYYMLKVTLAVLLTYWRTITRKPAKRDGDDA